MKLSGQRLVIEAMEENEEQEKPHYTLDELLAQCNPRARRRSKEDAAWLNSPRIGLELL